MDRDNVQTLKKENNELKVQLESLKQDLQRTCKLYSVFQLTSALFLI